MHHQFIPNPYRIAGDVAYIGLADRRGIPVAEALIDIQDLPRVLAFGRWCRMRGGDVRHYYAYCNAKRISLHRFILSAPDSLLVDHRNHDALNCQRVNLRLCDHTQNMQNRRGAARQSVSGVRNVSWNERNQNWRVTLKAFGKRHHIGYFTTLDAAEAAAIEARRRLMPFAV